MRHQLGPSAIAVHCDLKATAWAVPGGKPNPVQDVVLQVITHWEAATGHNIKGTRVVLNPAAIRVPTRRPPTTPTPTQTRAITQPAGRRLTTAADGRKP